MTNLYNNRDPRSYYFLPYNAVAFYAGHALNHTCFYSIASHDQHELFIQNFEKKLEHTQQVRA